MLCAGHLEAPLQKLHLVVGGRLSTQLHQLVKEPRLLEVVIYKVRHKVVKLVQLEAKLRCVKSPLFGLEQQQPILDIINVPWQVQNPHEASAPNHVASFASVQPAVLFYQMLLEACSTLLSDTA